MEFLENSAVTTPSDSASSEPHLFVSCDMVEIDYQLHAVDALFTYTHGGLPTPPGESESQDTLTCYSSPRPGKAPEARPIAPGRTRERASAKEHFPSNALADTLLERFFGRFHGKPYHVVNECEFRRQVARRTVPHSLLFAVFAVACQYALRHMPLQIKDEPNSTFRSRLAQEASESVDLEDTSMETLQAALLLAIVYSSLGDGRRAYMFLTQSVGLVFVLGLHLKSRQDFSLIDDDAETRRQVFWTCYLLDRYMTCDSHRPPLISDEVARVRTFKDRTHVGNVHPSGTHPALILGIKPQPADSNTLLIDITHILGIANVYLASGGAEGDSEYPWTPQSKLSRLELSLESWVSSTGDSFSGLARLLAHPDASTLVLSKLIYHLIYCTLYRPFLPINLAELGKESRYQFMRLKATQICYQHANAITEMVNIAHQADIELPSIACYAIATAATVHVHGQHCISQRGESSSPGPLAAFVQGLPLEGSLERLESAVGKLLVLQDIHPLAEQYSKTLACIRRSHAALLADIDRCSSSRHPSFNFLKDFYARYSLMQTLENRPINFDVVR